MRNALYRILTFSFLLLLGSCGIKWATNKVLTNRDAIEKVGAVYDALTPKDTTERIVFIQGDSIVVEKTDTIFVSAIKNNFVDALYRGPELRFYPDTIFGKSQILIPKDTIRIRTVRNIRTVDTIIRKLPPDNRAMDRLLDSLGKYTNELNKANGTIAANNKALKTAENRLIWMAGLLLLAGIVIGILVRFKVKI